MITVIRFCIFLAAIILIWATNNNTLWFYNRYSAHVPLYLTHNDIDSLFPAFTEPTRQAAKKLLDQLSPPTPEKTSANCAVVGNAGNLKGSGYGATIDNHDYVWRINSAPLKGFEQDTGKRTTHHVTHSNFKMIGTYTDAPVTLLIADDYNISNMEQYKNNISMYLRWLLHQKFPNQFEAITLPVNPIDSDNFFPKNLFSLKGGVRIIHPDFIHYIDTSWFRPPNRTPLDYPSNGLKAIILALHSCDKVDIFGFGINHETQRWDHYYDEGDPIEEFPKIHRATYQEVFLDELEQRGFIKIYRGKR